MILNKVFVKRIEQYLNKGKKQINANDSYGTFCLICTGVNDGQKTAENKDGYFSSIQ